MIRSLVLVLSTGCAALLSFAAPQSALAQYGGDPVAPQYAPYQPPSHSPYQSPSYGPYQSGPTMQDLAGDWFMSGNEDEPCQIIPSRLGDRALFINEHGGRAEGFLRGNRLIVPAWANLQGRFQGDKVRWSNGSVWTR